MLTLIAAYGDNYELGLNGTMPWQLSGDFQHVKEMTIGKTLLMGRKTFDSLPGVLPKRNHIIVTANPDFHRDHPRVRIVHDLEKILRECAECEEEVVVFGGASLYSASLPYLKKMYLTHVLGSFEADTYFPEWDPEGWKIEEESEIMEENGIRYQWVTYVRQGENE